MREVGSGINYTIRADSDCTLVVMVITGHDQSASGSDGACLLGRERISSESYPCCFLALKLATGPSTWTGSRSVGCTWDSYSPWTPRGGSSRSYTCWGTHFHTCSSRMRPCPSPGSIPCRAGRLCRPRPCKTFWLCPRALLTKKQKNQNWYGPGESDCLIKTKHCNCHHSCLKWFLL